MTRYEERFLVAAPPARVFTALTDADALRTWFAESAEVEPRVGGAYLFWGRHTPWIESRNAADGRIERFEPSRELAYSWTWRGEATQVGMELGAQGAGTSVQLSHATNGDLGFGAECVHLLADFWTLAMGNLRAYLAKGTPSLRPDYSDREGDVVLSIEIDAPRARVWRALVEPGDMNRWIARSAEVELTRGGAYSYGWTIGSSSEPAGPRQVRDFVPGTMLEHDWHYGHDDEEGAAEGKTSVRWELKELPGGRTLVTLRHRRPPHDPAKARGAYQQGWGSFLLVLKDHLEAPPLRLRKPKDLTAAP